MIVLPYTQGLFQKAKVSGCQKVLAVCRHMIIQKIVGPLVPGIQSVTSLFVEFGIDLVKFSDYSIEFVN